MSKTIQSRIQHSVYTAAVLKAKNPVLLKGEVVYESDTCKYKIGDGSTACIHLKTIFEWHLITKSSMA